VNHERSNLIIFQCILTPTSLAKYFKHDNAEKLGFDEAKARERISKMYVNLRSQAFQFLSKD